MGSNNCSMYLMCFAAIAAMSSVALTGIAFSTDNWRHISVDRTQIEEFLFRENVDNAEELLLKDPRYFDRVQGLFRVCFPHENKPETQLYLNPVEEWCSNVDYFFQLWNNGIWPRRYTRHGEIWFHVARCTIAVFCFYFMFMAIGCVSGLLGCWKASGDHLITTAVLFLLASLAGASGMGLWHWAQFMEIEKVTDERLNFYRIWPDYLKEASLFTLGWSYTACWFGIGLALLASFSFSCAAISIRSEFRELEQKHVDGVLMRYSQGARYVPYHTDTVLNQPNACAPESPSFSQFQKTSLSTPNYYSVGYPVQYEEYDEIKSDKVDTKSAKYSEVVKEFEGTKL